MSQKIIQIKTIYEINPIISMNHIKKKKIQITKLMRFWYGLTDKTKIVVITSVGVDRGLRQYLVGSTYER